MVIVLFLAFPSTHDHGEMFNNYVSCNAKFEIESNVYEQA